MEDVSAVSALDSKTRVYGALFVALLVFFAATPFAEEDGVLDVGLDLVIIGALLTALRAVTRDRKIFAISVLLALSASISEPPMLLLGVPPAAAITIATVSMIAFLLIVSVPILVDTYRASVVSFQTILGACSMFLILGFVWYGVFALIEVLEPNSFALAETHASDVWEGSAERVQYGRSVVARQQLFYFTFVTVTTLGFGDIQPVSTLARTYTTLAAVFGQLFLAILIARLVGIHSAQRREPRDSESRSEGE